MYTITYAPKQTMLQLADIKQLLAQPQRIVITTHRKPDGDAIGSSLGLYHFLKNQQHDVLVIAPTDYPASLHFLSGDDTVMLYETKQAEARAALQQADIIFMLDFNALYRVNELGDDIAATQALKILIDHHLQPTAPAQYKVWNPKASSTAELVYEFVASLDKTTHINTTIAECLYTGIVSDTGRFKFSCTPRTHEVVSQLMALTDLDIEAINTAIFDNYAENRLRFTGFCLTQRLKVWHSYRAALIYLSIADFERHQIVVGDTAGLVNFPLSLQGIRFVALIKEGEKRIKLSLRSKGNFSVDAFARKHFAGGGHKNAAGGSSNTSLQETIDKFTNLLPLYQEELQQDNL